MLTCFHVVAFKQDFRKVLYRRTSLGLGKKCQSSNLGKWMMECMCASFPEAGECQTFPGDQSNVTFSRANIVFILLRISVLL